MGTIDNLYKTGIYLKCRIKGIHIWAVIIFRVCQFHAVWNENSNSYARHWERSHFYKHQQQTCNRDYKRACSLYNYRRSLAAWRGETVRYLITSWWPAVFAELRRQIDEIDCTGIHLTWEVCENKQRDNQLWVATVHVILTASLYS